jgi:hypothetical protein
MKHSPSSPRLLSLLPWLALAASPMGCDPADEAPPPAAPQNAVPTFPPPGYPPTGDPQTGPPGSAGPDAPAAESAAPDYASGEYTVGEDTDSYDDQDPSALTDFRDALSPYGAWVDDPTYGTVWVPSSAAAGADFRPYVSGGHWTYDDDWVWVSDYPWGWAPFHYGRWASVEGRGWAWIPGRAYRGAWVTWSVDDGYSYVGWAPMPPLFVWFGGAPIGWRGGYFAPRWAYCPHGEIFSPSVGTRVLAGPAVAPVAARMRLYAPAGGRVGFGPGPVPARLGFAPAQIPRPTGAAATGVVHAQQFARPSTAQAIGARPPSRVGPSYGQAQPGTARPFRSQPEGKASGSAPFVGARPASHVEAPAVVPHVGAPHASPAFHSGGHFGGSGGHRR